MLKDFFYFSKGQRAAIIILLAIIVLSIAGNFVLNLIPEKEKEEDVDKFLAQTEDFMHSLKSADSIRKLKQAEEYYKNFAEEPYLKEDTHYSLFPFNPNTADSITFSKLGIKSYVIKNILRYKKKGGKFTSPDDFAHVWGLTPEKFAELKPYILSDTKNPKELQIDTVKPDSKKSEPQEVILVDINSADTAELMTVKGIGRKYANGIIKYRTLLGGYYDKNQVLEVYGMTPENFEKIKDKLTVSLTSVTKIDVNKASAERLRSHPYLNFYQAKAIYELRRKKGKLRNIAELNPLEAFTSEQLKKIEPYLKFE
jgi:competence ComEA-like helix-hairpin-helix protein